MADLSGYVAAGIVSFVVALLFQYLEPKAKIVYWAPHIFSFELKNENVFQKINSLTVQNTGRKPSGDIDVIHKQITQLPTRIPC